MKKWCLGKQAIAVVGVALTLGAGVMFAEDASGPTMATFDNERPARRILLSVSAFTAAESERMGAAKSAIESKGARKLNCSSSFTKQPDPCELGGIR